MNSTFGVIIYITIFIILFLLRKRIGRTVFGIVFFISTLFFSIYMLDELTHLPIRQYFNLTQYDETIEDPQGKLNEIAEKGKGATKKASEKIDKVGSDLDKQFGISREDDERVSTKEWTDVEETVDSDDEKETSEKEKKGIIGKKKDDKSEENITKSKVVKGNKEVYTITYDEIDKYIKNELSALGRADRERIKGITPTLKTTIKGDDMTVSNKNVEEGYLKITIIKKRGEN